MSLTRQNRIAARGPHSSHEVPQGHDREDADEDRRKEG